MMMMMTTTYNTSQDIDFSLSDPTARDSKNSPGRLEETEGQELQGSCMTAGIFGGGIQSNSRQQISPTTKMLQMMVKQKET